MEQPKIVDFSSLDVVAAANAGAEIEIMHPLTNEPTGLKIKILGRDSNEFKAVTAAQNRRRVAKMTRNGIFKSDAVTQEEMDRDGIAALVAVTVGWNVPVVLEKDKPGVEFSSANAKLLYERQPWIKEQVDSAIYDRANFSKTP